MKLSELIAVYGDDKVQFQNLDECATDFRTSRGITKITFGAEQPFNLDGTEKLGLVVWLDRDLVKEIIAVNKAGAPHDL